MQTHNWTSAEFHSDFAHCSTLKDVIAEVEKKMWSDGHVICEINVNGMRLGEEDELRFANEALADVISFSVKTDLPTNLMAKTVADIKLLMPAMDAAAVRTSELFRVHDLKNAHQNFSQLLEMCRYLTDVIWVLKCNRSDAISKDAEVKYQQTVREILVAFEKKDYIMLADLLEYELTNVVEMYKQQISVLT